MAQEREPVVGQAGKDDLKDKGFFWLVQNSKGEILDTSRSREYVELVKNKGVEVLMCKTEVVGLRPIWNEEGKPGVIIYVGDGKAPAVTGTVRY